MFNVPINLQHAVVAFLLAHDHELTDIEIDAFRRVSNKIAEIEWMKEFNRDNRD